MRPHAIRFDEMRATRHQSLYKPNDDAEAMASRVCEAVSLLGGALPAIGEWLIATRPTPEGVLVPIRAGVAGRREWIS